MKWILGVCFGVFFMLQYQLWFGHGGILAVHHQTHKAAVVQATTDKLHHRNSILRDKIKKLKTSKALLEGYARRDLGMIKHGEVFYYDYVKGQSQDKQT